MYRSAVSLDAFRLYFKGHTGRDSIILGFQLQQQHFLPQCHLTNDSETHNATFCNLLQITGNLLSKLYTCAVLSALSVKLLGSTASTWRLTEGKLLVGRSVFPLTADSEHDVVNALHNSCFHC